MAGFLAAICGLDASGKSLTQRFAAEMLRERGIACLLTSQPTAWWREHERVRATLRLGSGNPVSDEALILMSAADRTSHQDRVIAPVLDRDWVVLCHRYVYSLYAYYVATQTVPLEWMMEVCRYVREPDVTVLLRVKAETSIRNVIRREGRTAKPFQLDHEFMAKTAAAFDYLGERFGFEVVDADPCPVAGAQKAANIIVDRVLARKR